MNFASFAYPPDVSSGQGSSRSSQTGSLTAHRPIRVTEDAVGELFTLLAFQIEYLLCIGKSGAPLVLFEPEVFRCALLGGVCIPVCRVHNASLLSQLTEAIRQASRASFPRLPTASANVVKMKLRVRVSREFQSSVIFGLLKQTQKQVIAVWEFRVVKTPTEVTEVTVLPSTQSSFASPVSQAFAAGAPANNNSFTGSTEPSTISVYSNEPADVRKVVENVIQNVFSSIDAAWYEDILGGDLVYEIDAIIDK